MAENGVNPELLQEDYINVEVQDDLREVPAEFLSDTDDEEYTVHTPELKASLQRSMGDISEAFESSESGSSDISTKELSDSMSSSASSSDAESGTYKLPGKKYLRQLVNGDGVLEPRIELEADKENLPCGEVDENNVVEEQKEVPTKELLEKVANYEVELNFTKKQLNSSQEEIARLKYENLTLGEELGKTIEKFRSSEDLMKKAEHALRSDFYYCQQEFGNQLDLANQELALERKLVSELHDMVAQNTNELCSYASQMYEVKHALRAAQVAKSEFQSQIIQLCEQKNALDATLKEAQLKNQTFEELFEQYEARESGFLDEIRQLKVDLSVTSEHVHSLNRSIYDSKLKYDTLLAERDEMIAQVHTELNYRDIKIILMQDQIQHLTEKNRKLVAESERMQKLTQEQKLELMEKDRQLEDQRADLYEGAEEKREAIRQLCYSLEYYRNEYHEFREALLKYKPVLAS